MSNNSTNEKKIDCAKSTLEIVNSWLGNIDQKISYLLALSTAIAGFLLSQGEPAAFKDFMAALNTSQLSLIILIKCGTVVLVYIFSLLSIIFFLLAVKGRVKPNSSIKSHLFFGTIGEREYSTYLSEYKNLVVNNEKYFEELIEQIHTNSRICNIKVSLYNRGLEVLAISILLLFIAFFFKMI